MVADAASDARALQTTEQIASEDHADDPELHDDALTDDALTGAYRIHQRKRGHRYSLDDVLTARQGAQAGSTLKLNRPLRYLDLGCGIGSVLLMVAYKHPEARVHGIEAQTQSFALAQRNVARNQQSQRVTLHHGDIRDTTLLDRLPAPFDLITGTPPYQPPGEGTPSPDPQRAHARVELRGGVEVYLQAAARLLAPHGRLVVCADARAPRRVIGTAQALGLRIEAQLDAVPYADRKRPLFTVWTLGWSMHMATTHDDGRAWSHDTFYARNEDGGRTAEAHALRRYFDLDVNEAEGASPPQRDKRQSVATRRSQE